MAAMLGFYTRALEKHRVLTNAVTAGVLYAGGDCMAQTIERKKSKEVYNYERTARMGFFGLCLAGPILTGWYRVLSRMTSAYRYHYVAVSSSASLSASSSSIWVNSLQGIHRQAPLNSSFQRAKEVALKVGTDVVLWQSPFLNFFIFSMCMLEGNSSRAGWAKCKKNFHDAWVKSIMFMAPVQTFNFAVLPALYNPAFVSFMSMVWLAVYAGHSESRAEFSASAIGAADNSLVIEHGLGKSISIKAGQLLEGLCAASATASSRASGVFTRLSSACSAASSDWSASAPKDEVSCAGAEAAQSEEQRLRTAADIQHQAIEAQVRELDLMRRTFASQALRIQSLREAQTGSL